jgi:hypothetical protein
MGSTLRISKVDAAQRQLRTAIALWFNDGDPVATHALAFAAYEILHHVSEKGVQRRIDLDQKLQIQIFAHRNICLRSKPFDHQPVHSM